MTPDRERFLSRLKAFGEANDRTAATRAEKMLNITEDTGWFLWMLLRAQRPQRLLEVGTSNGYSTIWWADALTDRHQRLVTLENNPAKVTQARANFLESGVVDQVELVECDAGAFIRDSSPHSFDWVFLDSERSLYVPWWPDLLRLLTPPGLIVVDNAVDKALELEDFRHVVAATPGVRQVLVPIGNGELFIHAGGG